MLYYNNIFSNYAEFKEVFGIKEHSNGSSSRKNKILLAFLKNLSLKEIRESEDYGLLEIKDIQTLFNTIIDRIEKDGKEDTSLTFQVKINDKTFWSDTYETDHMEGICEDGDTRCIRVNNRTTGKLVKVKMGKMMKHLISCTHTGRTIVCEALSRHIEEEMAHMWQTYTSALLPSCEYRLVVDKNFSKIYDSDYTGTTMNSCMTNKGYHTMYRDSIECSAAYLENASGDVVARAILFEKVHDADDPEKTYRFLERQYSRDSDELLKRLLIDALIKEGRIDCYKKVGAGCSDINAIVDVNGNSLSDKKFWIEADIEYEDTVSYMDTFKYYNICKRRAGNYSSFSTDYYLDITAGSIENDEYEDEDDQVYDNYHDYYCYETVPCFVGEEIYDVDINNLDNFVFVDDRGYYYHEDDVVYDGNSGDAIVEKDAFYSKILDEHYLYEDDMLKAEEEYKKDHARSDYDEGWFLKEDLTTFMEWNSADGVYMRRTISKECLSTMIEREYFTLYEGTAYDLVSTTTGKPFLQDSINQEADVI